MFRLKNFVAGNSSDHDADENVNIEEEIRVSIIVIIFRVLQLVSHVNLT